MAHITSAQAVHLAIAMAKMVLGAFPLAEEVINEIGTYFLRQDRVPDVFPPASISRVKAIRRTIGALMEQKIICSRRVTDQEQAEDKKERARKRRKKKTNPSKRRRLSKGAIHNAAIIAAASARREADEKAEHERAVAEGRVRTVDPRKVTAVVYFIDPVRLLESAREMVAKAERALPSAVSYWTCDNLDCRHNETSKIFTMNEAMFMITPGALHPVCQCKTALVEHKPDANAVRLAQQAHCDRLHDCGIREAIRALELAGPVFFDIRDAFRPLPAVEAAFWSCINISCRCGRSNLQLAAKDIRTTSGRFAFSVCRCCNKRVVEHTPRPAAAQRVTLRATSTAAEDETRRAIYSLDSIVVVKMATPKLDDRRKLDAAVYASLLASSSLGSVSEEDYEDPVSPDHVFEVAGRKIAYSELTDEHLDEMSTDEYSAYMALVDVE